MPQTTNGKWFAADFPDIGAQVRLSNSTLEGQSGFEARAEAFKQRHLDSNTAPVPFYLMPTPLKLVSDNPGSSPQSACRCQRASAQRSCASIRSTGASSLRERQRDDDPGSLPLELRHCFLQGQRHAREHHASRTAAGEYGKTGDEIETSIRMILRAAIAALKRAPPTGYLPPIISGEAPGTDFRSRSRSVSAIKGGELSPASFGHIRRGPDGIRHRRQSGLPGATMWADTRRPIPFWRRTEGTEMIFGANQLIRQPGPLKASQRPQRCRCNGSPC